MLVTACAIPGAPVGWGGKDEIVMANPKAIVIRYDRMVGGYQTAMQDAEAHCQQYHKDAVPTMNEQPSGLLFTQTFECR